MNPCQKFSHILCHCFFGVLLTLTPLVYANEINGRVVGVTDGDTLKILTHDNTQHVIRLAEIDAPERKQPFGGDSKRELSKLVFGKSVSVRSLSRDRYDRVVGRVYVDTVDVSSAMISSGSAWVYIKYASDPLLYELEIKAKKEKIGLWKAANPLPPWIWRRGIHDSQPVVQSNPDSKNCVIKGNINRNGVQIYHIPNSRDYSVTKISIPRGERWFCTEEDAIRAGWRKPYK